MGQVIARLNEKLVTGMNRSSKQQDCKNMLHDATADDADIDMGGDNLLSSTNGTSSKMSPSVQNKSVGSKGKKFLQNLSASNTPKNIMKLRCDPRSPSSFDRTPLKVTLEDELNKNKTVIDSPLN